MPRLLGLVGGSSYHSTIDYYSHINRIANEHLGGVHAARCVLWSMNFGELVANNQVDDQVSNLALVLEGCQKVEQAGAQAILLCANTLHMFYEKIQPQIGIPILHIVDATAAEIKRQGLHTVIIMGTKYTMELPFYRERLAHHGITALIPNDAERVMMNETIYEEFGRGIFSDETRRKYLDVIERLKPEGAQGAIMGCTEIPLLLKEGDADVPLFDTTLLHAQAGAAFYLETSSP